VHEAAPRLPGDCFLRLAASGAGVPIATDLVLQERDSPEAVRADGRRLAAVVCEAAQRWRTPLAIPLMDLRLEKEDLVSALRPEAAQPEGFQFDRPPTDEDLARAAAPADTAFLPRQKAQLESVALVADRPDLVPMGMTIGPFSLTTRLMADPIAAMAFSGHGVLAEDEPLVATLERCLVLAERAVHRSLRAQLAAGATAVIVCEPAVSTAFLSPRQIEAGSDVFERLAMEPLSRVKARLDQAGALLFLHDCGELTTSMVAALATRLRPAVLSLGSSRRLWEDAAVVPADVVLYGNLPTRHFHSDETLPLERVREMARELVSRMRASGHPFILGSECDVLDVPGAGATIRRKVEAMLAEPA